MYELKNCNYYVTPNYVGNNYIMIIKKYLNKLNAYIILKNDIKYKKIDIYNNNIKIFKLKINSEYINLFNEYDYSIFEGKEIKLKNNNTFLIYDIYYYKGKKFFINKMEDKSIIINNDLSSLNNILNSNFKILFIELFKYDDIKYLVYNHIYNNEYEMNGLLFLPERSGKKLLYINDNEFLNIKNNKDNLDLDKKSNYNSLDYDEKVFIILATNIIDVYNVYSIDDETNKIGIASVPNIELSHKLRKYFSKNDKLITKCIFDTKFNKWKPLL